MFNVDGLFPGDDGNISVLDEGALLLDVDEYMLYGDDENTFCCVCRMDEECDVVVGFKITQDLN